MSFALQDMTRNDTANVGKGGYPFPWNSTIIADPNGDLIYDTLDRLPDNHETLTCIIDPLDPERVVALNPLAIPTIEKATQEEWDEMFDNMGVGLPSDYRDLIQQTRRLGAEGIVQAAMMEIFARTMGVTMDTPRMFQVLQNVVSLVTRVDTRANFRSLYRVLTNEGYRRACLMKLDYKDELTQNFWENVFPNMAEKSGGADLLPIINRVESLMRTKAIGYMLGQRIPTINLRQKIDQGFNIFFRFSPELSGNKAFMLAVSFNLIKQAVFSRADVPKAQRRLVSVYLDEFQEMVGADASALQLWLEQARKFGGAVFLGHQNLDQVSALLKSIKGTVSNLLPMSVGPEDREFYAKFMDSPAWPYEQILNTFQNLPPYAAIGQFQYNGQDYPPVLLNSLPMAERTKPLTPALIAKSCAVSELHPLGYELLAVDATTQTYLQLSKKPGFEGFWEVNETGQAQGYRAVSYTGGSEPEFNLPGLIEELTRYLYQKGVLRWGINPSLDPEAFAACFDIEKVRTDPETLKKAYAHLFRIERLSRIDRQKELEAMIEEDWQLYRASRRGRDYALATHLAQNRNLIPDKRSRVLTFSRLFYGTPIAEIEAEAKRPDKFMLMIEKGDLDNGDSPKDDFAK